MRRAEEQASELRIAEGRLLWLLTGDGPHREAAAPLTLAIPYPTAIYVLICDFCSPS